jgi:predicted nuclease of predicted toxin-antitoxin system
MKFKTDEHLPVEVAALLNQHGHDAVRVDEQRPSGVADAGLAAVCQVEQPAIVTLDLDFADIRAYPPENYAGIIVLRPAVQTVTAIVSTVGRVVALLASEPLVGCLWVVDDHRVRIRQGSSP